MLFAQCSAARIVAEVLAGRNLTSALEQALNTAARDRNPSATGHDRALTRELAYGTLRHYARMQAYAAKLIQKPPDALVQSLILVALYQLDATRGAPHAVVDHAVKSVAELGHAYAKGFVNAVLRRFLREGESVRAAAETSLATRLSYPQWWIDKLQAQYPHQYIAMLEAGNAHPPMCLRVNLRRGSVEEYLARLRQQELPARHLGGTAIVLERPVDVTQLPGFADGLVSVQDSAAQLAATLLDVHDGMRVLDACAAPGGKTGHLLELADLRLLALDDDAERLRRVESNLTRLGHRATLRCADAAQPAGWWDGVGFERILLDVPCSASGVVRRHPDIKWLRRPGDVAKFAQQQRRLLEALWPCLARHGKLLYASCSVFAEENQQQIAGFLGRHDNAKQIELDLAHGSQGQIIPDNERDGFYYALLEKRD